MKHYKATRISDGEIQFLVSEDDQDSPPGYDPEEWTFETISNEPTDKESLIGGVQNDPAKAEQLALDKVEESADKKWSEQAGRFRMQIAIASAWREVQMLKLAQATNTIPTDLVERQKQYPLLMSMVSLSGDSLSTVAVQVENRLWNRVKSMSLAQAKMMLGRDAVRSASTAEEKINAAFSINWND